MARLVETWFVYATPDSLLLRPAGDRDSDEATIRIDFRSCKISGGNPPKEKHLKSNHAEVYGVIGILNLVSSSHLIMITQREQVAQIRGQAVFAVKDVAVIPLTSQPEAQNTIDGLIGTKQTQQNDKAGTDTELSDVGEDAEESDVGGNDEPPEAAAFEPPKGVLAQSTTFTKNVVQDRGRYGRFATSWFSKDGPSANVRWKQGMSSDEGLTSSPNDAKLSADTKDDTTAGRDEDPRRASAIDSLTPRILRTARLYFSTSGFYFSYGLDLTRTSLRSDTSTSNLALWKRFDSLYLWNANLMKPFVEAEQHDILLPLTQGFVGQRSFSITKTTGDANASVGGAAKMKEVPASEVSSTEAKDTSSPGPTNHFLLTLISRRSVKRAGLRYLRRGVDDDGNVANAVESEQILSSSTWDASEKIFSLIQWRGSIPLHFTQSPYSFKPTPVIQGSETTNQTALEKHFTSLRTRYGQIQAISLVDKHGPENSIGQSYEDHVKTMNEDLKASGQSVDFEWFDFHKECKGMKFENVSILLSTLMNQMESFDWTEERETGIDRRQTGVLRTNCMDCLDRTNVVQSAVAGWALEQQLLKQDIKIDLKNDSTTQWFNTLWADNGDAISRQYAGTAALKGDFTRNRKRNWTGALSDFSLTMNRYYRNIFGDYFLQTCIDYFLGNTTSETFDDFETDMMAKDDHALDLTRIRQNAIDTCVKIVLEDPDEYLIDAWTLSSPRDANTLRTLPFEECIVLLTDVALYFCRFDWATDKVWSFEKVTLTDITEIWQGAYVTSAFGNNLDERKNVGFALRYRPAKSFLVRRNTRTLQSDDNPSDENSGKSELEKQEEPGKDRNRLLAFKALPVTAHSTEQSDAHGPTNEVELVKSICGKLLGAIKSASRKEDNEPDLMVEDRDIISATEAKKSTGYVESIGYSLKKLVWS